MHTTANALPGRREKLVKKQISKGILRKLIVHKPNIGLDEFRYTWDSSLTGLAGRRAGTGKAGRFELVIDGYRYTLKEILVMYYADETIPTAPH